MPQKCLRLLHGTSHVVVGLSARIAVVQPLECCRVELRHREQIRERLMLGCAQVGVCNIDIGPAELLAEALGSQLACEQQVEQPMESISRRSIDVEAQVTQPPRFIARPESPAQARGDRVTLLNLPAVERRE